LKKAFLGDLAGTNFNCATNSDKLFNLVKCFTAESDFRLSRKKFGGGWQFNFRLASRLYSTGYGVYMFPRAKPSSSFAPSRLAHMAPLPSVHVGHAPQNFTTMTIR
jgi:hypothetical protein